MPEEIDHVAIVVRDTERALALWRDVFGLQVVLSETARNGTVLLTNLSLGDAHLQLVEPLSPDHALLEWLGERESALHHLGLGVDDLGAAGRRAADRGLVDAAAPTIPATLGRRALFLDAEATGGVVIELIEAFAEA